MHKNNINKKIENSILVAIVGDALGVPLQATPRHELSLCAIKNMLGYGRYDHPQGTWSDDSAMILCTIDSLLRCGYDIEDLGETFCKWIFEGYWTPHGYVFDAGFTTSVALDKIRSGTSPRESGGKTEEDNGNGSLMRILPAALYFLEEDIDSFLKHIHEISAITHAHPRALIGCGLYSLYVKELIWAEDKFDALKKAMESGLEYYSSIPEFKEELTHYMRILSLNLHKLPENEINSSGYVVDTLEASLWSFLNANNSKDAIVTAVNLGLDTDTTGAVAGGLAGLYYGTNGIPEEWINTLARYEEIKKLIGNFSETIIKKIKR